MSEPQFPEHVDDHEVNVTLRALGILSRDPSFRAIVRLFQSRIAQGQPIEPLKQGVLGEVWKTLKRDAGLP